MSLSSNKDYTFKACERSGLLLVLFVFTVVFEAGFQLPQLECESALLTLVFGGVIIAEFCQFEVDVTATGLAAMTTGSETAFNSH